MNAMDHEQFLLYWYKKHTKKYDARTESLKKQDY